MFMPLIQGMFPQGHKDLFLSVYKQFVYFQKCQLFNKY